MSLFVKICGITSVEAGAAAVEAGADAVGFVFAPSPRQVTTAEALAISGQLPSRVLRVAVFRRPGPEEIEEVLSVFTPDLVQADHDVLTGAEPVATLPVFHSSGSDLPEGGRFLYEGPVSGSGQLVDLRAASRVARLGEMVLAGGLTPDNVDGAIEAVRPFGVDVSSGVEMSPGRKDPSLIRSFVAAARAASERLVNA